jgi:hypothetical protein
MNHLPAYISLTFGVTTVATLFLFISTIRNSMVEQTRKKALPVFVGLVIWLVIQAVFALNDMYSSDTGSFPPKIMLTGIFPAVLAIVLLFLTRKGRRFTDSLPLKSLTWLHVIRIPVEIVLLWLFIHKAVPELMTFEGWNFDILSGITTPIIVYFGFKKVKPNRGLLLIWNLLCLGLLVNIVVNALLSAPSPIQQLAFEQPNIAILYFPFSWLPTFVVPIVLFGHLAAIRQLLKDKTDH